MKVDESMTYYQAKEYCQEQEGHVLEIYSKSEHDYILGILSHSHINDKTGTWLGASVTNESDQFQWEFAKTVVDPDNWTEIFSSKRHNSCLSLIRKNKKSFFAEVGCHEQFLLFCKTRMNTTKNGARNPQNRWNKHDDTKAMWAPEAFRGNTTLHVFDAIGNMSWSDTDTFCQSKNMSMVVIDTDSKFRFVQKLESKFITPINNFWVNSSRIWLGAKQSAMNQHQVEWVNGVIANISASSWHSKEKAMEEKCVYTFLRSTRHRKNLFYLENCNESYFFDKVLCEEMEEKCKCGNDTDCHQEAKCVSNICICNPGFAGDGYHCFDIDECRSDVPVHVCSKGHGCVDTLGSYNCSYQTSSMKSLTWDHKRNDVVKLNQDRDSLDDSDPCSDKKCYDGEECVVVENTWTCKCKEKYFGFNAFCRTHLTAVSGRSYSYILPRKNTPSQVALRITRARCAIEGGYMGHVKSSQPSENLKTSLINSCMTLHEMNHPPNQKKYVIRLHKRVNDSGDQTNFVQSEINAVYEKGAEKCWSCSENVLIPAYCMHMAAPCWIFV